MILLSQYAKKKTIMHKFAMTILLSFSFASNSLYSKSKSEIFGGYTLLACGVFHFADIIKRCPTLYDSTEFQSPEEYLNFLEKRVVQWQFLTENPTEEHLCSFRSELLEHYDKILSKRSLFSMIFTDWRPMQPWALFKEEIQQHLDQLYCYKFDRLIKKTKNDIFNTNEPLYPQEIIDKVNTLEKRLRAIKKCLCGWPTYQSECTLDRQEFQMSQIYSILNVMYCFYFAHQILKD